MHLDLLSVAASFCAMSATPFAQAVPEVKLPASPVGQAAVQLGGRWEQSAEGGQRFRDGEWVVVDYSRPLLRGRADIFGSGADYGRTIKDGSPVWRSGANDTTRLTTQASLQIGDKTLPPGVYNGFVDLKPGNWTLVLNTQPVQEKYDSKFDVMRVPMTVKATWSIAWDRTVATVGLALAAATK